MSLCLRSFMDLSVVSVICLHRWPQPFGLLAAPPFQRTHTNSNAHKPTNFSGPSQREIKKWYTRIEMMGMCIFGKDSKQSIDISLNQKQHRDSYRTSILDFSFKKITFGSFAASLVWFTALQAWCSIMIYNTSWVQPEIDLVQDL